MAEEWMSLRAYARHRKVALSAVQKAIDSRRVTAIREENGRITGIEKNQADAQWAANTDALEAARSGKFVEAPAPGAGQGAPASELTPPPGPPPGSASGSSGQAGASSPAAGDQGNFLAARVKEAELRGQLLELDKLERIDELLPRSVVQQEFSEIFAQLRNAIERAAGRCAQAIAGDTGGDVLRIERMLLDNLRKVLDDHSRRLAESAGMADDAAVAAEREAVLP